MKLFNTVLVIALLLGTLCCGGGQQTTSAPHPPKQLDPQGNWYFDLAGNATPDAIVEGQLYELAPPAVTSNQLNAPFPYNEVNVCGNVNAGVVIVGAVSGTDMITYTMSIAVNGNPGTALLTLNGTITANQEAMSGTWTALTGNPCGIGNSGTWTAHLLPPITGTWMGSLTNSGGAITLSAVEDTSQTDKTMGQITGTISFTGSPCFAASLNLPSWTVAGPESLHFGQVFSVNTAPDATGASLQGIALVDVDATTMTFYVLQIHGGACDGQEYSGSTLTIQP